MMMPEKDGFEVVENAEEDERTSHPHRAAHCPADVESRIAGLERGADDYLAKPFHRDELLIHPYPQPAGKPPPPARTLRFLLPPGTHGRQSIADRRRLFRIRGIVEERLSDSSFEIDSACPHGGMVSQPALSARSRALPGVSPLHPRHPPATREGTAGNHGDERERSW